MKKLGVFAVASALCFTLTACGDSGETKNSGNESQEEKANEKKDVKTIKEEAKTYTYDELKDKKAKKGASVKIEGKVITSDEVEDDDAVTKSTYFNVQPKEAEEDSSDVFVVRNDSKDKFKIDDNATIYGTYVGLDEFSDEPTVEAVSVENEASAMKKDGWEETDAGFMKPVGYGYNDEVGIDGTDAPIKPVQFGSMQLYIKNMSVYDLRPNEDSLYEFDNQEQVRVVLVDMKVKNTADQDITFYPDQAILTTDTGEQVESDLLGDDLGGDFLGKVEKEGMAMWVLKDHEKELKNIKMIISPPYGMDSIEDIGQEKRLDFEILNPKDAKERDAK
ncbi:hypothetical protein BEH_24225 [Priestia filamentosa]|uniref:DUF4352 domain-containing protein n=1 Tax=Priestia filamentosa TaxID=1402861 RepID=A0A2S1LZB3_9BACI|nr:hypothetical protein [Priestia filamentosa]AWG44161.1 hypothetical protein BEH_24225 [Priestia filamentosa]